MLPLRDVNSSAEEPYLEPFVQMMFYSVGELCSQHMLISSVKYGDEPIERLGMFETLPSFFGTGESLRLDVEEAARGTAYSEQLAERYP